MLVKICTIRNRPICDEMLSMISSVIFFFVSVGPASLDEFPPEQLVRQQDEVGEEQDHDQLIERRDRAQSIPTTAGSSPSRAVPHLHADNAWRGLRRIGLRELLRRLLDFLERARARRAVDARGARRRGARHSATG